jgi:hypothetical protein
MRTFMSLGISLALSATAAQAMSQTAPRAGAADPAVVQRCRALAMEMVDQVQSTPMGPLLNQQQRAADTALGLAATAARMSGGAAGALTSELINGARNEAEARAEEARAKVLEGIDNRLEGIEARMEAAGCTDAVMGAAPVFP